MLVDTRSDRKYQRYCDKMEQQLYIDMVPILTAGVRLQINRSSVVAQDYVNKRGGPTLLRFYRKVYVDQYDAITAQQLATKAAPPTLPNFMREQTDYLTAEAGKNIRNISQSLSDQIGGIVTSMVADGKSNNAIAREISKQAPEIGRTRAATIARTETHNASLAAIEETLKYKNLPVKSKTWQTVGDSRVRPSHAAVHGETIPMADAFTVGGSQMMRPGDDSLGAGAEEIVNCRCSILYNTEGLAAPSPDQVPGYAPGIKASGNKAADDVKADWFAASPFINNIADAIVAAKESQLELGRAGSIIARLTGTTFKNPGVKTDLARIASKVNSRGGAEKVTDLARASFIIDRPEQVARIVAQMGRYFEVAVEDWRVIPDQFYTDRVLQVRFKNGLIGEVQIVERRMFEAKMSKGHKLYEQMRVLDKVKDAERIEQLNEQMRELYGSILDDYGRSWKRALGIGGKRVAG